MQRSKPEPEPSLCPCGREAAAAAVSVYRSPAGRFIFSRCECGAEWTQRLDTIDQSQAVSIDEVLEVHEQLLGFEGSLAELIGARPAS